MPALQRINNEQTAIRRHGGFMTKRKKKLTRTQRRKLLFTTDGPDAIDFEQRRIGGNRYSASPRRREDKKLLDALTATQQEAYNLIERGRHYASFGLPVPRMPFTDARGGCDTSLSDEQDQIRKNYLAWRKDTAARFPGPVFAVMSYLDGKTIRSIEYTLRISRNTGAVFITKGLTEYCLLAGLRDPRPPRRAYWGISRDVQQYVASYFLSDGRAIREFKNTVDTACPETA
jgi:hypothetical protein